MSNIPSFSSKDLEKALKNLGFAIDKFAGKGGHYKAKCPQNIILNSGQRSFIVIPHTKEIYENLRNKILKEIKNLGITKEEFLKALKK